MKKILFLVLSVSNLFAQNEPDLIFANKEQNSNYGGTINSSLSAKDIFGNFYLVGIFSNVADFDPSATADNITAIGSSDLFVTAYDGNGNYLSTKNIGGTGFVNPTAITISGGFLYLAGTYTNTIDFDPSAAVANLTSTNVNGSGFLVKYDLNGNFIACKSINGVGTISINDMKFFNNEIVITGNFFTTIDFDSAVNTLSLTSNGANDVFIAKYNSSLQVLSATNFGGSGNDYASSAAIDSSGNIIVSGSYIGTVDFDPSPNNLFLNTTTTNILHTFIAKYSTSFVLHWAKDIGGRSNQFLGSVPKLILDSNNNIITTGSFNQASDFDPSAAIASLSPSIQDIFMAKYDANGNYLWATKIGGSSNDSSRNIAIDSFNNIHIIGTFVGIVDFDPLATTSNLDSASGTNFFAKYNNNGIFISANNLFATINTVLIDNNNSTMLSGTFSGTRDFDPSAAIANLTSVSPNVFLAKYATNGTFTFAKAIGGDKPTNTVINFIATDGIGNIYRTGLLSAITDLDPSAAVFNVSSQAGGGIFISKYTPSGALLWGKEIIGGISSFAGLSVMNTDPNGNTYIVGRFGGTVDFDPSTNVATLTSANNGTSTDHFIVKYDSNGSYLWAKQLTGNIGARRKLVFDSTGNFYFSGTFSGNVPIDVDPSPTNVFNLTTNGLINSFFVKFNPQGDFIWAKNINSFSTSHFSSITQFDIKDNNLYMTGRILGTVDFNPSPTVTNNLSTIIEFSNETFFAKYNLNGDYQFAFKFDNEANSSTPINKGSSFAVDTNGDIFLLSTFSQLVDFDPSPTSIFTINDPSFNALAISKYSTNGTFAWAKLIRPVNTESFFSSFNSIQSNEWLSSAYLKDNELIITGEILGNIDFDPSTSDFLLNSSQNLSGNFNFNVFIAKYNKATGNFINANKIEGDYTAETFNSTMDNNQNLLLAGRFLGTADFDFSSNVQNLASASPLNYDRFYAKYNSNTLGITDIVNTKKFILYPNPTNSILNIQSDKIIERVTIIDVSGRTTNAKSASNNSLDVSNLSSGMYFIEIKTNEGFFREKFIKN